MTCSRSSCAMFCNTMKVFRGYWSHWVHPPTLCIVTLYYCSNAKRKWNWVVQCKYTCRYNALQWCDAMRADNGRGTVEFLVVPQSKISFLLLEFIANNVSNKNAIDYIFVFVFTNIVCFCSCSALISISLRWLTSPPHRQQHQQE